MSDGIRGKQFDILAFPYSTKYQSLICDGAVRSGKTSLMTVAFIDWAMREFNGAQFGICGKTVGNAIKNIVLPYMALQYSKQYNISFRRNDNVMAVSRGAVRNLFYLYGGKDESSYMLIQGITLAGVLLDEVALMARSFVEQALARCLSYPNRRYWFNCNPESPTHWFYTEWIQQAEKHRALHLHFLMSDNPSISAQTLDEAARMYSGVFYRRYVLGEWVRAEGLIYPMFDRDRHTYTAAPPTITRIDYGVDVGHSNATAYLAIGQGIDNRAYVLSEYYHSGKDGITKSPSAYAAAFVEFRQGVKARYADADQGMVYVDPSAKGFIQQLKEADVWGLVAAEHEVLQGIRVVMSVIDNDLLRVHTSCKMLIDELSGYSWDSKAAERGEDKPIKEKDHTLDSIRYYFFTTRRRWIGRRVIDV